MNAPRIRQVDPAQERANILAVLHRNLPLAAAERRFDWLYLDNPEGPALVWLADGNDGSPIGTSAAHPRRVRIGSSIAPALVLGDFAIDASERSLGPALGLLRATLEPVRQHEYVFACDFPNPSMRAVDRRVGMIDIGPIERWVYPLSLRPLLRDQLGSGQIARAATAIGDALLEMRWWGRAQSCTVDLQTGGRTCGDDYDALDERLAATVSISGLRDAPYLNWRLRNPIWHQEILRAERDGVTVGYAIVRKVNEENTEIIDLRAEEIGVAATILSCAAERAAAEGAARINIETLRGSASARLVASLGFTRRERHIGPLIAIAPEHQATDALQRQENWWLTGGDRDT